MSDTIHRGLVLVLSSWAPGNAKLDFKREVGFLREATKDGNFEVERLHNVDPLHIDEKLRKKRPAIVHFSGHGTKKGQFLFSSEDAISVPIDMEHLSGGFKRHRKLRVLLRRRKLRCVVLSACFSAKEAECLAKVVDYVIAMEHKVRQSAVNDFSYKFYEALSNEHSVTESFQAGLDAVGSRSERHALRLWVNGERVWPETLEESSTSTEVLVNETELPADLRGLLEWDDTLRATIAAAGAPLPTGTDELLARLIDVDEAATADAKASAFDKLGLRFYKAMEQAVRDGNGQLADRILTAYKRAVPMFARCFLTDVDDDGVHRGDGLNALIAEPRAAAAWGRGEMEYEGVGDGLKPTWALPVPPEGGMDADEWKDLALEDIHERGGVLEAIRAGIGADKFEGEEQQSLRISAHLQLELGKDQKSRRFVVIPNCEKTGNLQVARALGEIEYLRVIRSYNNLDSFAHNFEVQLKQIYKLHSKVHGDN